MRSPSLDLSQITWMCCECMRDLVEIQLRDLIKIYPLTGFCLNMNAYNLHRNCELIITSHRRGVFVVVEINYGCHSPIKSPCRNIVFYGMLVDILQSCCNVDWLESCDSQIEQYTMHSKDCRLSPFKNIVIN